MLRRQPLFHFEFPEDGGGGPTASVTEPGSFEPESEPWSPSREEWEQMTQTSQEISALIAQQQAATQDEWTAEQHARWEEAVRAALDPLDENHDPMHAYELLRQLAELTVAPLRQELEARRYEDQLAEADDEANDLLLEAGVEEGQLEEVRAVASDRLRDAAISIVLAQYGYEPEQITRAAQSPDPAARQWAENMASWAAQAAQELYVGNREAATIALQEAATLVRDRDGMQGFYESGGTLSDRFARNGWFGGSPAPPAVPAGRGDYTKGGSVADRFFGGGGA
jgi:hypothetical protein